MRLSQKIALLSLFFSSHVYAVLPGFYIGLMTGPATNDGGQQMIYGVPPDHLVPATPKSKQWGSRIYMGYQIGRYAGFEGGLTYFSAINYDTHDVPTCADAKVRVRDFDIVGKGIVPFNDAFDIYGKAGLAITYVTTSGALNPGLPGECGKNEYKSKFLPTVSIGTSYAITQNWVVDLSWNRLMVGSQPGNVDLIALGISYHIVDVFCGQFLCD